MKFIVAVLIFFSACAPRIVGYTRGDCLVDPADGICRTVSRWELQYRLKNKTDCMRAKYSCPEGEYLFGNRRGCGCARPVFSRSSR